MKTLVTRSAFAAAALLAATVPASAQLCGVSLDCDWPVPDVGYWAFDETSGETASDSINSNDAIWQGGAGNNAWVGGLINGAAQMNDENGGNGQEHFDIATMSQLSGATGLSISLWFNQNVETNNNSTYNGLFMSRTLTSSFGGGSENWGIALENNNSPRHIDWRIDGVPGAEDDLILGNNQDRWDHVVFTWDGTDQGDGMGERALFLNGAELQREDAPLGSITSSGDFDIGNDSCCGSREFTGTLDEAGVWSSALSATDVSQIYNAGMSAITLDKVEPALLGDTDEDGDVDLDDVTPINSNFFQSVATRAEGDLNSDGVVDWIDFAQWKENFPTNVSSTTSTVPEPTGALLLALGLTAVATRSRR
ncbi:hypothetical protein MalM25_18720 [Planctomycetes bacterium MalM25]|nr:hypothetical protein MalM25_18720 [Planctomycetes bacterium MalM25]